MCNEYKNKLLDISYSFCFSYQFFDMSTSFMCVYAKSLRVRFLVTLRTVAHQVSSVHGILQARILEWVVMRSNLSLVRLLH